MHGRGRGVGVHEQLVERPTQVCTPIGERDVLRDARQVAAALLDVEPLGEMSGELGGVGQRRRAARPRLGAVGGVRTGAHDRDERALRHVPRGPGRAGPSVRTRPLGLRPGRRRVAVEPVGALGEAVGERGEILLPRLESHHARLAVGERSEDPRQLPARRHRRALDEHRDERLVPAQRRLHLEAQHVLRGRVEHGASDVIVDGRGPVRADDRDDHVGGRHPAHDVIPPLVAGVDVLRVEEHLIRAEAPPQRVGNRSRRRRGVGTPVADEDVHSRATLDQLTVSGQHRRMVCSMHRPLESDPGVRSWFLR